MLTPEQKIDLYHFVTNKVKRTGCYENDALKEFEASRGLTGLGKTELRDAYSKLKPAFAKDPNYVPVSRGYHRQPNPNKVSVPDYDNMTPKQVKELLAKMASELAQAKQENAQLKNDIAQLQEQHEQDLEVAARAVALDGMLRKYYEDAMLGRQTKITFGKDGFVEKVG